MENKRNYYRILHVQPDAPVELIKMSYRTIMQKLRKHPDLGGDEWDASVINEAYAVLSDKKLRAAYDARLLRERSMADAGQQTEKQRAGQERAERNSDEAGPNPDPGPQVDEEPQEQAKESAANKAANDAPCCLFCGCVYQGHLSADRDCANCHSPLQPHVAVAMEESGQRLIQRQEKTSVLQLYTHWPSAALSAVLLDLSLHGLKLRFAEPLTPGHILKIVAPEFVALAKVVRCEQQAESVILGAQFVSLRLASQRGTFVQASA